MSLAILFHFLCAQHVSDINISIIRSLRLCCWITTSVVLFSVRCAFSLQHGHYSVELPHWSHCSWFDVCWSFGVVGLEWYPCCRLKHNCFSLQHEYHSNPTTPKLQHTSNQEQYDQCGNSTEESQAPDILMSETCWAHKKWNKIASDIKLVFYSSTITMMHGPINIRLSYIHSINYWKKNENVSSENQVSR